MGIFPWSRRRNRKAEEETAFRSAPRPDADAAGASVPGRTLQPPPGADAAVGGAPKRLLGYQVANLQGLGTCERQEDAFAFANVMDVTLIREKGLLAVVADGMGGMKDGRLASETVVSSIRQDFGDLDYRSDMALQLRESLCRANEKAFALLDGEGGSTAVVCLIYQEQLYFASVGDSFLYLKRNGRVFRLNRPQNILHELYLEAIRGGTMDPSMARQDPEGAALTQFLGIDLLEDIDLLLRPLPLMSGDILLLCTDGVAGGLNEEQLIDGLTKPTPQEMCTALEQMVKQASAGQYQDNYTALIIQCKS